MDQRDIVDKDQIKLGGTIQPLSPIGSPPVRETAGSLSLLSFRGFMGISFQAAVQLFDYIIGF